MGNININVLTLGMVSTNCYIVSNEDTKEAIIFDPSAEAHTIMDTVTKEGLKVVAILLTHGHFDHILAVKDLKKEYDVQVYASEFEKELLEDGYKNCSITMGGSDYTITPDILLKNGEILEIAGMTIEVIHTPGHTSGGVCYLFPNHRILISGDTLFKESVGRSDLPTGNGTILVQAIIDRLMVLDEEVTVLPGHGEPTTIGHEKRYNRFIA